MMVGWRKYLSYRVHIQDDRASVKTGKRNAGDLHMATTSLGRALVVDSDIREQANTKHPYVSSCRKLSVFGSPLWDIC